MKNSNQCPSCGAGNDLILTNCIFCGVSLPKIDIDSISNEDLVLNAGEWVGKSSQSDYFIDEASENANVWTGKGIKRIHIKNTDIVSNAQKYLSLIQVRSISNPNLLAVYQDLKSQLDENILIARENDPQKQLREMSKKYTLMAIIVFIITILILAIFRE